MTSKTQPILVDWDPDDPDIEILSHKQGRSQHRVAHSSRARRKESECIVVPSSSDHEDTAPSKTESRTNGQNTFTGSSRSHPVAFSNTSYGVKFEPKVKNGRNMDKGRSATVQQDSAYASNVLPKVPTEVETVTALPSHHQKDPPSDGEDEIWEETYTIVDALNEYPTLNEYEVYERVAHGDVNTTTDIYRKIIRPQIEEEIAKEYERLAGEMEQLAAKPRPPDTRAILMPRDSQPVNKPASLAHSTRKFLPPSLLAFGRHPLRLHKTNGRPLVPDVFRDWTHLRMVQSFRAAPAINQISQSGKIVAIGSAAFGGHNNDPPTPHNTGPSLIFWRDGFDYIPINNHSRRFVNGELAEGDATDYSEDCLKHYTVNDIKFDPQNGTRAVSCASDGRLFAWDFEDEETFAARKVGQETLKSAPQELLYRSDSVLAVVTSGSIYVYRNGDFWSAKPLLLEFSDDLVATAVWGEEASYNYLFATWQPNDVVTASHANHKAFDVRSGKFAFRISDSTDPGSSIAISPEGQCVALSTCGSEGHKIRLYDVRLRCSKQISSFTVQGFEGEHDIEHMKFDPYGDYVAVGRTDNFVQILDVRANKFIHEFHHAKSVAGPGGGTFGITGLRWITGWQGIGLRLFTGGDDGCVRMWDVRSNARDFRNLNSSPFGPGYDPLNGFEIAREAYPIGHFAVGKTGKYDNQEMALVVGDQGGQVSVYDRKGTPYYPT